jgi:hypothetical protein
MNTFYYHNGEVHISMSSFCFPSIDKKNKNLKEQKKTKWARKERKE